MNILEEIKNFGYDNVAKIDISQIEFDETLVEYCKMNSCGNYGKCYTCPPHVGDISQLINNVKKYKIIILFQKIYHIEDSFDIEGMIRGNDEFKITVRKLASWVNENIEGATVLTAGGCKNCIPCNITKGLPCADPKNAFVSLEACGINVSSLAPKGNMKYINGVNTTTYFGGVLINEDPK